MGKNNQTCTKILLISVTILFISVLLVKRFAYFRPSTKFILTRKTYKDISINNLHGWLSEVPNATKIILICHGNKANISHHTEKLENFNQLGYNVLIFDYSGYGNSTGIPSEQQIYNDASIITATLCKTYTPNNIILYGQSLGAAVASYIARRYRIPHLIMEAPLPSMKELIKSYLPNLLNFLAFPFTEFNTQLYLDGYFGKSLCIYSLEDELINYTLLKPILALSSNYIQTTGSHDRIVIPYPEINKFIEET
jgi:uncharacterized protein